MEYVKDVLKLAPREWEDATYTGKRFVLKDVDANSEEFSSVTNDLSSWLLNKKVVSVQRIQHPFAYGRFMLHKEQMQKKHLFLCWEKKEVLAVVGNFPQVETFIDYNCDERRRVHSFSGNKYFILKRVLVDSPERDTNWYPEYLVQYE